MPSPTIDGGAAGSNTGAGTANTVVSGTLTTSHSPDLIFALVVGVHFSGTAPAINLPTDTLGGLTWTQMGATVSGTLASQGSTVQLSVAVFTAPAAGTVSGAVTGHFGVAVEHACIIVFGTTGLYSTADPFDGNAAEYQAGFGDPSAPTLTYSTSQPDDLLLLFDGNADSGTPSTPAGWTQGGRILDANANAYYGQASVFYKSVSATQSGQTVVLSMRGSEILCAITGDAKGGFKLQTFVTCF